MPIPVITALIAAGATAGTGIYAANKTSGTAEDAAKLQSDALQQSIAFQKQQAENAYQNSEVARRANYGQWAAGQRRLGSVGDLIGAPSREIPSYVPGIDPNFAGGGPTTSTALAPTSAGSDPITQALADNYSKLGVKPTGPGSGPTDIAYYAQKIQQTGGLTPQNTAYWFGPNGRIATDLAKAGAPSAPVSQTASVGTYQAPYTQTPITPELGSVGSYLG